MIMTVVCLSLSGCGSTTDNSVQSAVPSSNDASVGKQITMLNITPYSPNSNIPAHIVSRCSSLGTQVSHYTRQSLIASGYRINRIDSVDAMSRGKNLLIEITDAQAENAGGLVAFGKSMTIEAKLYENGELIDTYKGTRKSNGGMFGNFKGYCSVLERNAKALGNDVGNWLQKKKVI